MAPGVTRSFYRLVLRVKKWEVLMMENLRRLHGNCRLEQPGASLEEIWRFKLDRLDCMPRVRSCWTVKELELLPWLDEICYVLYWFRRIGLGRMGWGFGYFG